MSALNKYEIAARLAAYGIDDEEIRGFLEAVLLDDIDTDDAPRTIFAEFVDAKRATASTYEAQARRARVACNSFEAVLAEIEAAENPEPASDDAPCARCDNPADDALHDHSDCSDPFHEPNTLCHPYQPAQPVMRYASGEVPMAGDVVRFFYDDEEEPQLFTVRKIHDNGKLVFFDGGNHGQVNWHTLVRRADTPEEAKDEGVDREPVRSIHAAKCLLEAMRALNECLFWDRTREGHDYWRGIYDRLRELAATAEAAK